MTLKRFINETIELLDELGTSSDFWWLCLLISLLGLTIMCVPTPPTLIIGAAIFVLPYVAYGIGWAVVGVASLIDYCVDKFADWKSARNGYARFESELADAAETHFATSPAYQKDPNEGVVPDLGGSAQYGSPTAAGSHRKYVNDFDYEPYDYNG